MVPHSSDQPTAGECKRIESGPAGVCAADPWARALLDLPALLLTELPEPIVLHLHVPGAPGSVLFTTCTVHHPDSRSEHAHAKHEAGVSTDSRAARAVITFDRDEMRALVLGVEADRIWHREFLGFCFEKWRAPLFRVSSEAALGGANSDQQSAWSSARFLRRLQARLTRVEFVEDVLAGANAQASPRALEAQGNVGSPLPLIWAAA
jgi:hypothetical protein